MRRRTIGALVLAALAPALLPGCIAAIGTGGESHEETPTERELTSLERRMSRVEERLPRQP